MNYDRMGFRDSHIVHPGGNTSILATCVGTVKTTTLALALQATGYTVERHDGFLEVKAGENAPSLVETLGRIASGAEVDLFSRGANLLFEKFHPYLTPNLLEQDALSSRLDPAALPGLCEELLQFE